MSIIAPTASLTGEAKFTNPTEHMQQQQQQPKQKKSPPPPMTSLIARHLITDGLHSIHAFLTNREWLQMSRTSHHYWKCGMLTPIRRLQIELTKRFDVSLSPEDEIELILQSPMRRHFTELKFECEDHYLPISKLTHLRSSLPSLEVLRVFLSDFSPAAEEAKRKQAVATPENSTTITIATASHPTAFISQRLQRLDLILGDSLATDEIQQLLASLPFITPNLTHLQCYWWRTDLNLAPLRDFHHLTSLSFYQESPLRSPSVRRVNPFTLNHFHDLVTFTHLTHLSLHDNWMTSNVLDRMVLNENCYQQLSSFATSQSNLSQLLTVAPNLTLLSSSQYSSYIIADARLLSKFTQLQNISTYYSSESFGEIMNSLSACQHLTRLEVRSLVSLSEEQWLKFFSSIPGVTSLDLPFDVLRQENSSGLIAALTSSSFLPGSLLHLHTIEFRGNSDIRSDVKQCVHLARFPSLTHITFTISSLTDLNIMSIKSIFSSSKFMPQLEALIIRDPYTRSAAPLSFGWNVKYATHSQFRQKMEEKEEEPAFDSLVVPPAPPLVGIELNPGPPKSGSPVTSTSSISLIMPDKLRQRETKDVPGKALMNNEARWQRFAKSTPYVTSLIIPPEIFGSLAFQCDNSSSSSFRSRIQQPELRSDRVFVHNCPSASYFVELARFTQCRNPQLIGSNISEFEWTQLKKLLADTNFSKIEKSEKKWFNWNINDVRHKNFRNNSNQSTMTPPAPRLVCIELNPGPTSMNAQSLFSDGWFMIFAFLNHTDFLTAVTRVCRSWYSLGGSSTYPCRDFSLHQHVNRINSIPAGTCSPLRRHLTSLEISFVFETASCTNAMLASLRSYPSLTSMTLQNLPRDADIESLIQYMALSDLTLRYAGTLDHLNVVSHMRTISNLPHLTSLSLDNFTEFEPTVILMDRLEQDRITFPMLKQCPLTQLGLEGRAALAENLVAVFPHLTEVRTWSFDAESLLALSSLQHLTSLHLERDSTVMLLLQETQIITLLSTEFTQLTELAFYCWCPASSEPWSHLISSLTQLRSVSFINTARANLLELLTSTEETREFCYSRLEELALDGTMLLESSLALLQQGFTSLRILKVKVDAARDAFLRVNQLQLVATFNDPNVLPKLNSLEIHLYPNSKFTWHRNPQHLCNNYRQAKETSQAQPMADISNASVADAPPAPQLVGIELNPGPTITAQTLFSDGLFSIFTFLSGPDFMRAVSRVCKSWFAVGASTSYPPHASVKTKSWQSVIQWMAEGVTSSLRRHLRIISEINNGSWPLDLRACHTLTNLLPSYPSITSLTLANLDLQASLTPLLSCHSLTQIQLHPYAIRCCRNLEMASHAAWRELGHIDERQKSQFQVLTQLIEQLINNSFTQTLPAWQQHELVSRDEFLGLVAQMRLIASMTTLTSLSIKCADETVFILVYILAVNEIVFPSLTHELIDLKEMNPSPELLRHLIRIVPQVKPKVHRID